MEPPPERAGACGLVRVLSEEPSQAVALVVAHDDVLLALAGFQPSPPARTGLFSHPEDDDVDALERRARERPVWALGVVLAAEILFEKEGTAQRLAAWKELGEAPLDVVARELGGR
jgi:hypothetical protein